MSREASTNDEQEGVGDLKGMSQTTNNLKDKIAKPKTGKKVNEQLQGFSRTIKTIMICQREFKQNNKKAEVF